jgi:hypothetical protein
LVALCFLKQTDTLVCPKKDAAEKKTKKLKILFSNVIGFYMRIFSLIISGVFLLSSCTDINDLPKKEPRAPEIEKSPVAAKVSPAPAPAPAPPPAPTYPFNRMIANASGQTIAVEIAAKQGAEIWGTKDGNYAPFVLKISQLSEQDQVFFKTMTDGGDLGRIRSAVERYQKLAGRVANWNHQFYHAEKEAAQLKLPLLTACLITDTPESQRVERDILMHRDFRNWANMNLTLCLLKLDSTDSERIFSISASENRKIASNFGVANEPALILAIPGYSPKEIPIYGISSVPAAIKAIYQVIQKPEKGSTVSPIPVPERSEPKGGKGKGK